MQNKTIVVLGTGGTIAGQAASRLDNTGYVAGQLAVADLVAAAIPDLRALPLELAQLDSKDMDHATWQRLAQRAGHHLARPEVGALVITHGTDTLEETAYFLQRVLGPDKPVVLTGAMRPASALQTDGPQNLVDAMALAQAPGAHGVLVVMAGRAHGAQDVRKVHPYQVDAFTSGDAGPVALVEEGCVKLLRPWPRSGFPVGLDAVQADPAHWPRVELLFSHAGSDGAAVQALVDAGTRGLVVAGCGNGNLHQRLQAALLQAQAQGVAVLRSTRCIAGSVVGASAPPGPGTLAGTELSAVKARVEVMLGLMAGNPPA
jgi:L-asparaginase